MVVSKDAPADISFCRLRSILALALGNPLNHVVLAVLALFVTCISSWCANSRRASHLAWQLISVDLNNRSDCMEKFKSNSTFGAIVWAAILAGNFPLGP